VLINALGSMVSSVGTVVTSPAPEQYREMRWRSSVAVVRRWFSRKLSVAPKSGDLTTGGLLPLQHRNLADSFSLKPRKRLMFSMSNVLALSVWARRFMAGEIASRRFNPFSSETHRFGREASVQLIARGV
jgi:hypothetical protein